MPPNKRPQFFWQPGTSYLLRMATHFYTGRLAYLGPSHLVLDDAAWVADAGLYLGDALKTGKLAEVEPYPGRVLVSLGALVDACEWPHPLPTWEKQ
jgi:hypothetical protein